MKYETRITRLTVCPAGKEIYDENATNIEITDDAAGEFIEVIQGEKRIQITPEEWPELQDAIDEMIIRCKQEPKE